MCKKTTQLGLFPTPKPGIRKPVIRKRPKNTLRKCRCKTVLDTCPNCGEKHFCPSCKKERGTCSADGLNRPRVDVWEEFMHFNHFKS